MMLVFRGATAGKTIQKDRELHLFSQLFLSGSVILIIQNWGIGGLLSF